MFNSKATSIRSHRAPGQGSRSLQENVAKVIGATSGEDVPSIASACAMLVQCIGLAWPGL